jgi:hypothetical protein
MLMNANELADDMENGRFNDINYNKNKAADFVRQQQEKITKYELRHAEQRKRIAELEVENKFFKDLMGDVEILRRVSEK